MEHRICSTDDRKAFSILNRSIASRCLRACSVAILVVFPAFAFGQNSQPPPKESKVFRFKHVLVDRRARTVTIEAKAVRAQYALEFLLCKAGTKDYESVLVTKAEPWQVHAGLLMLGLSRGLPASLRDDGKYLPPRGGRLGISIHWKDRSGRVHKTDAADWLKSSTLGKGAAKPKHWIFVGSDILADGGYAADATGGIIAVANLSSAVIDVPLVSTKTIELREFVINPRIAAPAGSVVKLVISPQKGAARADYARALLEIDRNGTSRVGGMPIATPALGRWAERFMGEHKKGMVVIRSDERCPGGFAGRAGAELRLGGVFDIEYRIAARPGQMLPRTKSQIAEEMLAWKKRFTQPTQQIEEPGVLAEKTLEKISRERSQLKQLDALWAQYEKLLKKEREKYVDAHKSLSPPSKEKSESSKQ